jgi:hypothetical protein
MLFRSWSDQYSACSRCAACAWQSTVMPHTSSWKSCHAQHSDPYGHMPNTQACAALLAQAKTCTLVTRQAVKYAVQLNYKCFTSQVRLMAAPTQCTADQCIAVNQGGVHPQSQLSCVERRYSCKYKTTLERATRFKRPLAMYKKLSQAVCQAANSVL